MNELMIDFFRGKTPKSEAELLQYLRELLQSLTLFALWRAKFFDQAAFYGETALRVLYQLDRYSEDLDFSLLKTAEFDFDKFGNTITRELHDWGFDVNFERKIKKSRTQIDSAFIKTSTYMQLLKVEVPENLIRGINRQASLKIKLEVDTIPPPDFNTEMKYVFKPVQFAVRAFTLPSLFAGKMHAVLCRKWKTRIKGRDWYDFTWYVSKYPKLNLKHLESRMRDSGDYRDSDPLSEKKFLQVDLSKN